MAKVNKNAGMNRGKTNFGTKRKGIAKKNYGPKEEKPKQYRGQGK